MADQVELGQLNLNVRLDEQQVEAALARAGRNAGEEAADAIDSARRIQGAQEDRTREAVDRARETQQADRGTGAAEGGILQRFFGAGSEDAQRAADIVGRVQEVGGALTGRAGLSSALRVAGVAGAIATAGAAVVATFGKLNQISERLADSLSALSPEGAVGRATLAVGNIRRRLAAARQLGPDIRRFLEARNRILDAIQPILNLLRVRVLRLVTDITNSLSRFLEAINRIIGFLADRLRFLRDLAPIGERAAQGLIPVSPFGVNLISPVQSLLLDIAADILGIKNNVQDERRKRDMERMNETNRLALESLRQLLPGETGRLGPRPAPTPQQGRI